MALKKRENLPSPCMLDSLPRNPRTSGTAGTQSPGMVRTTALRVIVHTAAAPVEPVLVELGLGVDSVAEAVWEASLWGFPVVASRKRSSTPPLLGRDYLRTHRCTTHRTAGDRIDPSIGCLGRRQVRLLWQ